MLALEAISVVDEEGEAFPRLPLVFDDRHTDEFRLVSRH